jgi:hypothetical protein
MPKRSGVFISYARSDGLPFATRLHAWLKEKGVPVWRDLVGMEGGRDWWLQITEALDHVEFVVLAMTPAVLHSEMCRREWRYARQRGVCVYAVMRVPADQLDVANLPRWMRDAQWYNLNYDEQWAKLLNDLSRSCQTPRVPFMVEDLPEEFVERPAEFDALINLLRDPKREEPIAMTAALRGAGGFGKTTLARALSHDERIQEAFDHGTVLDPT